MPYILFLQSDSPQSVYSCSTSSDDYFKVTCCHTYRPQPIEHVQEKHATDHTPQRQVEFPYTNIVRIVHSPTRATTQGFLVFIRHPEPQLKRCYSEPQLKEYHLLNPHPEPQLMGCVPSHNSRNTSNLTLKASLDVTESAPSDSLSDFSSTAWRSRYLPPGAVSVQWSLLV